MQISHCYITVTIILYTIQLDKLPNLYITYIRYVFLTVWIYFIILLFIIIWIINTAFEQNTIT